MTRLAPGTAVDAATLALPLEPLPVGQVTAGAPSAGSVELAGIGDREVGVWEHTPGTSTDVESDEVFVVLAGSATVTFDDPALPPVALRPGVVVRLAAGMGTTWTVHETIRKVYIA